jgi:hypothetical protein
MVTNGRGYSANVMCVTPPACSAAPLSNRTQAGELNIKPVLSYCLQTMPRYSGKSAIRRMATLRRRLRAHNQKVLRSKQIQSELTDELGNLRSRLETTEKQIEDSVRMMVVYKDDESSMELYEREVEEYGIWACRKDEIPKDIIRLEQKIRLGQKDLGLKNSTIKTCQEELAKLEKESPIVGVMQAKMQEMTTQMVVEQRIDEIALDDCLEPLMETET